MGSKPAWGIRDGAMTSCKGPPAKMENDQEEGEMGSQSALQELEMAAIKQDSRMMSAERRCGDRQNEAPGHALHVYYTSILQEQPECYAKFHDLVCLLNDFGISLLKFSLISPKEDRDSLSWTVYSEHFSC